MKRSLLYFAAGTFISFLLNYYFLGSQGWAIDIYYGVSFGLGWGLAYFVDHPEWTLTRKMGTSLLGIGALVVGGLLLFNLEIAVPSIIKFSTVFVAYYLFASFRTSKSLRF